MSQHLVAEKNSAPVTIQLQKSYTTELHRKVHIIKLMALLHTLTKKKIYISGEFQVGLLFFLDYGHKSHCVEYRFNHSSLQTVA